MADTNGLFRAKKVYFSQISNEALRDIRLSLKAKGLYSLIQSYITIENFTLYKSTLRKACTEGDTSFKNAWDELKEAGYLRQYKFRDDKGHFKYEYELLDKIIPITQGWETHPMDNSPGGKGGSYNNTDLNNTYLNNTDLDNKKEKGKTGLDKIIADYTNNSELQDSIREFIKMRKSIKKPMTNRALELLLSKLDKLSGSVKGKVDILNQSIFNSWQGIFPLKNSSYASKKESGNNLDSAETWDPKALGLDN